MKPAYWDQAARELAGRDRVLRRVIRAYPGVHLKRRADPFTTLARAIVGQQISVKAADSIWRRFVALVDQAQAREFLRLEAVSVAATAPHALRACGLSQRKAEYLIDLAEHFASGRLDPKAWRKLDDEALIAALIDVKGIGRWTAEMFLMFHELRPDVLPVDDIGLQRALAIHYNEGEPLPREAMFAVADLWRPWRSVATWYLWRSLDPIPVEY
ncbi:MAG TPA: DNA-3-methyladenine glycosylase [Casimicrobiaceae bacterium]|nr:DNA-3-methyladenine glycosylase [Casimicrobiaceae bacterium]